MRRAIRQTTQTKACTSLSGLRAFVFVPSTLPLNVLVVENNPDRLYKTMAT